MSNTINTPVYTGYDNSNHGASSGDKVSSYIQGLLNKNGISGNVQIGKGEDGRLTVLSEHPEKNTIENLLNNDTKLASMLGRASDTAPSSVEQNASNSESGKYYENADGDSVFVSDSAQEALAKQQSNYLGATYHQTMSYEEFLEFAQTHVDPAILEADKMADFQVNWKSFSNFGQNLDTFFDMRNTGSMVFEHSLGSHIPLRGLELDKQIQPGKSANIQEKEVMAAASLARQKAYQDLQSVMKRSGIDLKTGEKLDFTMDEKGNIKVNPKSKSDKGLATKVEHLIKDDSKVNASIRDFLHVSMTSTDSSPAMMRMHVDTVLKEHTGKGFDDLEWDSSGNLVIPEGFDSAVEEWGGVGGLTSMVGHLKSLQESEGDGIFKKEFTFSVTASGIKSDQMKSRASTSLFRQDKMFDNKVFYTNEKLVDVNGNTTNFLKVEARLENFQEEYHGMQSLQHMIQDSGTSVFISPTAGGGYAVDKNGNRQALPYQSENYAEAARFLIEDYLIENGIEGDVSDYALQINKKGSYDIVLASDFKTR